MALPRGLRVASLFSGCGGLDLGLEQAGHQILLQCECDPSCQQVLKRAFPGVLLCPDVCGLDRLPKETELVAAGFPCIDLSRAGLRNGINGQSSGLVRHVFRLLHRSIQDGHPVPWVLFENVDAILDRVNGGPPAIQMVTDALEQLGYNSWAHRVVCSAGFGLPNRRKRLFLVASMHGDARDVLLSQGMQPCLGSCTAGGGAPCYECYAPPSVDTSEGLDRCSCAFDLGNARSPPSVDVVPTFTTSNNRLCLALSSGQVGMLRTGDAERLQGLPEGHTEPCWPLLAPGQRQSGKVVRDADSEARERARFALIGNAVTVPVARWIGEWLRDPYHKKYTATADHILPKEMQSATDMSDAQYADQVDLQASLTGHLITTAKPVKWSSGDGAELTECGTGTEGGGGGDDGDGEGGAGPGSEVEGEDPQEVIVPHNKRARRPDPRRALRWPPAAWYVRRMGRFAPVAGASECPVKGPFCPLGAFLTQVGQPPSATALHTYFMRCREQGFDCTPAILKMARAGAALPEEIKGVVRLLGNIEDSGKGTLVWAKDVTKLNSYWPAEALDPFTCKITPAQVAALPARDRALSLPPAGWAPDGAAAPAEGARKVLVVFFGDRSFNWQPLDSLLPYAEHKQEKTALLEELIASRALRCRKHLDKALQEASLAHSMAHSLAAHGPAQDNGAAGPHAPTGGTMTLVHPSAAWEAAKAAAAANNNMPRCNECEACTKPAGHGALRRCLAVRAAAAAAAGHTGAQLAVLGRKCIGACVSVWWPLDEAWYEGQVAGYDHVRVRHTIHYNDGDKEIIPLWAPGQMVRVLNTPKDWPAEAERLHRARETQADDAAKRRVAIEERKAEREQAEQAERERAALAAKTPYERERDERLAQNQAMLERIMGPSSSPDANASAHATATASPDADASPGAGASAPQVSARGGGGGGARAASSSGHKRRRSSAGCIATGAGAAAAASSFQAALDPRPLARLLLQAHGRGTGSSSLEGE